MYRTPWHFFRGAIVMAALAVAANLAQAIGPQYQYVGDSTGPFTGAPTGTLNEVVRLQAPPAAGRAP